MAKNKKLDTWDLNISKSKINVFFTKSAQETRVLGKKFALVLKSGDIVFLKGNLGSGKTTFVQGIVKAFYSKGFAKSSSFTIVNEYNADGVKLFHIDLYRLEASSVWDMGLEEYLYSKNISLVEWPDRLIGVENDNHWNIEIENIGLGSNLVRKIKIEKMK
jgi:tRNA threonylcarbamoyladenosine biosynthesis protein TsaE